MLKRNLLNLLGIILHPITYYWFAKYRELMVMFSASASTLKIKEPSVYDIDSIKERMNEIYDVIHEDPNFFESNGLSELKANVKWTVLISRFKKIEISRDTVRSLYNLYSELIENNPFVKLHCTDKGDPLNVALSFCLYTRYFWRNVNFSIEKNSNR